VPLNPTCCDIELLVRKRARVGPSDTSFAVPLHTHRSTALSDTAKAEEGGLDFTLLQLKSLHFQIQISLSEMRCM
jgi:hypothetical protein